MLRAQEKVPANENVWTATNLGIQANRLRFTVNSNIQEVEHESSDASNCGEEEFTVDASTQFEAPDDPLLSEVLSLKEGGDQTKV